MPVLKIMLTSDRFEKAVDEMIDDLDSCRFCEKYKCRLLKPATLAQVPRWLKVVVRSKDCNHDRNGASVEDAPLTATKILIR